MNAMYTNTLVQPVGHIQQQSLPLTAAPGMQGQQGPGQGPGQVSGQVPGQGPGQGPGPGQSPLAQQGFTPNSQNMAFAQQQRIAMLNGNGQIANQMQMMAAQQQRLQQQQIQNTGTIPRRGPLQRSNTSSNINTNTNVNGSTNTNNTNGGGGGGSSNNNNSSNNNGDTTPGGTKNGKFTPIAGQTPHPQSNGNSQGHTPLMQNQPAPPQQQQQAMPLPPPPPPQQQQQQFPLMNGNIPSNITPVMPPQQQPTPQSQPRGGPQTGQSQGQTSMPVGQSPPKSGITGGLLNGVGLMAGGVGNLYSSALHAQVQAQVQAQAAAAAASGKPMSQQDIQNELNAKIFKKNLGNAGIIRALDMIDQISSESPQNLANLTYWQRLMQVCFTPSSLIRFTNTSVNQFQSNDPNIADINKTGNHRQFEVNSVTAPRFFQSICVNQNVAKYQIALPGIKFQIINNGSIFIASKLTIIITYSDDSQATLTGTCKLLMNRDFRIEWVDCTCMQYQPSILSGGLESQWQEFLLNQNQNQNQNRSKNNPNETQKEFFKHIYENSSAFTTASNSGLDETAMRVLNTGDVMSCLKSLMVFSVTNNMSSPLNAMEQYLTMNQQQQQQQAFLQQQQKQQQQLFLQQQIQQQIQLQVPHPNDTNSGSPSPDEEKGSLKRRVSIQANGSVNSPAANNSKRRK